MFFFMYIQQRNITDLDEFELYVFRVTAINQVGESNLNATTMIITNESCKTDLMSI